MIALSFWLMGASLIYSENIYTQTAVFCNVVLVLFKDGYIHETQKLQTSDGSGSMGHIPITDMITYKSLTYA